MLRPKNVLLCALALIFSLTCSVDAGCPDGDVRWDCEVNYLDLRDLAAEWLNSDCSALAGCRADVDGIAGVDMGDFARLAENWLESGSFTLVINEFMADNEGTIEDPDESGEFPDWFEIYNYGDEDIDIGGMYVRDDSHWWRIPVGYPGQTTVEAGGHLLLWADSDPEQGPLHVDFALGKGSDQIGIYDAYRNLIDVTGFWDQVEDRSRGRLPDGSGNWITFEIGGATPGGPNRGKPVEVVISEIMYHPGHAVETPENIGQEYIELYNKGGEAVSLGGWRFTDGVDFIVPGDPVLRVGEYLVVASDVNEFTAKYPGVTNVVGGWDGRLSNSGERIELVDKAGVLVDVVHYADQGEWAVRRLGPEERDHRGWEWSEAHDGDGKSLELINPALANEYGQNWSATDSNEGTPGAVNTVNDSDIAPLIVDVEHFPIIPGPNDTVAVTAQVIDELSRDVSARLHYRVDSSVFTGDEDIYPHHEPNDYNDAPMFDDGAHGDGAAGDGLYGAEVPGQPHGTIIEFYVETSDLAANSRTWPAASLIDGVAEQVTNALYQVDGSFDADTWMAGSQPIYYLIMIRMEEDRLEDIVRNHSDLQGPNSQMNATFVSVDGVEVKVRHNTGLRNRGHGTRRRWPNNYRVNFAHDKSWEETTAINLNSRYTYVQLAGSAIFRLSGLPTGEATAVQVRTNGENLSQSGGQMYGSYVHVEVVDSDFAENHFPDDDGGNAYKGMRDYGPADFEYRGSDPDSYRNSYFKETNTGEDDWADLIELCDVLDRADDADYVREVRRVINAEKWLLYLALNALLDNNETSLANGYGDDYYIYRGILDPRFVVIMHDLDSVFGYNGSSATRGIFRATGLPTINRLLTHPEFIGRYYFHLKNLIETTLSVEQFDPFLDELLGDFVPAGTIGQMKDFVARRNAHVLSLIPLEFTIDSSLPVVDGYHHTTIETFTLSGTANAVETRSVLVNGEPVEWSPVDGTWSFGGSGDITEPIVERGSVWKYLDDGSNAGTSADGVNWFAHPDYNDSLWPKGAAELGYGDAGQGRPEETVVGYIDTDPCTAGVQKNITTYFRHTFDANDVSDYLGLQLGVMADDGAAVYLNGVEIENARSNLPEGAIDYLTTANASIGSPEEYTFFYYPVDVNRLNERGNVLAVEIHQANPTSADISFALELNGILPNPGAGALNPGINRVVVQAFDAPGGSGNELDAGYIDIWYDTGTTNDYPKDLGPPPGELSYDTIWTPEDGPYRVISDLTVPVGVTLTIMPGVTVFFEPDAKIIVKGTLVADGLEYESIRFTSTPGASGPWHGLQFLDTGTDNRLTWSVLEYGQTDDGMIGAENSNLLLDHSTLDNTELRRIRTIDSSLIVSNCWFTDIFEAGQPPSTDNRSEHIWGRAGDTGWFVIENNVFGLTPGHNDGIDVDGPSRPKPIPQILNNIFLGGGDDALDLESDAHIEGNVFANYLKDRWNNASGESNVISAGSGRHYVMARNSFHKAQHIAQVKDDAFLTFVNNTVVDVCEPAIYFDLGLPGRDPGRGADVDGSIFWGSPDVFAGVVGTTDLAVDNSMIPFEWHSFGAGNIDADPLFVDDQGDFRLKGDSGAIGAGAWGLDMGAYVPAGAAISGEPYAVTYHTDATLTVGGPGITHYKYSLNSATGPWSTEISVDVQIELTGLVDGQAYTVYAIGKNSAGVWQSEESRAASHTWTIDTSHSELLINEVLAHTHGTDPDIMELYYDGPVPIDLTGMALTDEAADPGKFEFSSSSVLTTTMNPGDYMILYGDLTTTRNHLGFALSADGEALYLYDKANPDGSRDLLDSVEFGPQINDFSIGRVGYDRTWKLNKITFGMANIAQPLGDPDMLKINEWLANGQVLFDDDFVELYNPHPQPVSLGGMYLTDNPVTQPNKRKIVDLSFVPPEGYAVFRANDGNDPSELDFKLSADGEMIGLFDAGLNLIDQVLYGPQTTDISQGRAPNGSSTFDFFELPTPGVANTEPPTTTTTVIPLAPENADKRVFVPTGPGTDDNWRGGGAFDDSLWDHGDYVADKAGGVGYDQRADYGPFISYDMQQLMDDDVNPSANSSVYVRIPFMVDGSKLGDYTGLTLKVRYDDGYVVYLNGVEITEARRNFTGTPAWDSRANGDHEAGTGGFDVEIDISSYISALQADENILAIQGINDDPDSSDFLISAELEASITEIDYGEYPYDDDLDVLAGLRITELMYNEPSGSNFDYIELQNISDVPIPLDGVRFVDGIGFEFPIMQLNPGSYIVVVSNLTAFRSEYGYTARVAGEYTGGLSGGGEDIVLILAWPLEAAVMRFEYNDTWYPSTDGDGQSLTISDASAHPATWNDGESWRPAFPSPGLP